MRIIYRAIIIVIACVFVLILTGCSTTRKQMRKGYRTTMIVTAYCPCGKCCNWKRSWLRFGQPVYASGPNKGKPKRVGICADGTKAKKGIIAADTRYYPFGTRMYIPGYGYGTVHDRGGAIKGQNRLDLFFPTHKKALQWGRQKLEVTVFR